MSSNSSACQTWTERCLDSADLLLPRPCFYFFLSIATAAAGTTGRRGAAPSLNPHYEDLDMDAQIQPEGEKDQGEPVVQPQDLEKMVKLADLLTDDVYAAADPVTVGMPSYLGGMGGAV